MTMIISQPIRPITLYVFMQEGCHACSVAKGSLEKFQKQHPQILIVPLNVTKKDWSILGYTPASTPAYLFTSNRQPLRHHEGVLNEKALENILRDLSEG